MPQVILMTEEAEHPETGKRIPPSVFVECELIPTDTKGMSEEEVAELVAEKYCSRCGFKNQCKLEGRQIFCFHPSNPYLAQLKEQIAQKQQR